MISLGHTGGGAMSGLWSYPLVVFQITSVIVFFVLFNNTSTVSILLKNVVLLTSVVFFSLFLVSLYTPNQQRDNPKAFAPFIIGAIASVVVLIIGYAKYYQGRNLFAFVRPSNLSIALYLLIIAFYIGMRLVSAQVSGERIVIKTRLLPMLLVSSINEEMYFRYYLDDILASIKITSNKTFRAVVISIVFSILHMVSTYSIPYLVGRFAVSFLLLLVKRSMKNPVYPIFLHFAINMLVM
jgi:membrane protease YdiL (CAAX protease family)